MGGVDSSKEMNSLAMCTAVHDKTMGDLWVPKKLLNAATREDGSAAPINVNGTNVIEIMNAYYAEIQDDLKQASKSDAWIDCAKKLNTSEEKLLSEWVMAVRLNLLKDASYGKSQGEFMDAIYESFSTKICNQYNEIALVYERKGSLDEAEDIYRAVLRQYPKIEGCFKEAEIAFENLRKKGNGNQ